VSAPAKSIEPLAQRIEPVSGLLYNRGVVGDLAAVVAPPYDLIGAARQRELYERSPYNVVRLELGRDDDPYAAAARTLAEWRNAGVLERAHRRAIYLYTQTFELEGLTHSRAGFIARIRLEEFSHGRILPHERTFPAAKADRLKLLTAIRTNVSPVFGLYSCQHPELDRLREIVSARAPMIELNDDLGIGNQLRPIEAPEEIAIVQRELAATRVLIADGHHRYETALNYRRARRAEHDSPTAQAFDYVMMALVPCDDPGLVILPTHRVVKRLAADAIASFATRARELFEVNEFDEPNAMLARLKQSGRGVLGVALRSATSPGSSTTEIKMKAWLLTLKEKDSATLAAALPGAPPEVRELDVSILHALVFDRIFSIRAEEIRTGGGIEYTIDARAALDAVRDGRADGAFLMNPPSIRDVELVSDAGATMPEKSTYFYPKLLTGLVLNPLDDEDAGAARAKTSA